MTRRKEAIFWPEMAKCLERIKTARNAKDMVRGMLAATYLFLLIRRGDVDYWHYVRLQRIYVLLRWSQENNGIDLPLACREMGKFFGEILNTPGIKADLSGKQESALLDAYDILITRRRGQSSKNMMDAVVGQTMEAFEALTRYWID